MHICCFFKLLSCKVGLGVSYLPLLLRGIYTHVAQHVGKMEGGWCV